MFLICVLLILLSIDVINDVPLYEDITFLREIFLLIHLNFSKCIFLKSCTPTICIFYDQKNFAHAPAFSNRKVIPVGHDLSLKDDFS